MANRAARALKRLALRVRERADSLRERPILFDVGSCDGKEFLERCRRDRRVTVYAFEPEPGSFQRVLENTRGLANFHAFPLAVSDTDGPRTFHVASVIGNHSFHEFVDGVDAVWKDPYVKQIPWLPDFRATGDVRVECVRLDSFMARMKVPYVSFLHVDAQGEDLAVLRSLGARAADVRAGVIEVCLRPLYKNQFTKADALGTLDQLGFRVARIDPDYFGLVENVYFERQ